MKKKTPDKVNEYGYKNIGFILDRGYFSKDNINYMESNGHAFIIMVKGNKELVSSLVMENRGKFEDDRDCCIRSYRVYGKTVKARLYEDDTRALLIYTFTVFKSKGELEVMEYNFYCDESLHLPKDRSKIMVLGGIWCPKAKCREINADIRSIKAKYHIDHEMKWVKLSESKKEAYKELVDYFFESDDLHFRVLVIDNKDVINHEKFKQTHDDWYYKMYFRMIKTILDPEAQYNIYMDIKDTKSKTKIGMLKKVLANSKYDFSETMIKNMQVVRSDEIEIMQIVDVLIGAMAYFCRNLSKVEAKNEIVEMIKHNTGYSLKKNTLYRESKFNIFHLQLDEGN